ncbi:MAG: monovalent cation/hydrogen antiporter [Frankiales bacterium]|jgi:CPA1 family monovalent cation:H+ antiporter|nr:monovalent cation/hydrogen antiporter [Frankiales bacterium]MDX6211223.1 monovalent cation/hydrogen antiporter [Frankiales bacterium]
MSEQAEPCQELIDLREQDFPPPASPVGCAECLREGTGWVSLHECRECGHVGCCDASPGGHATAHHWKTQHPVMRSLGPGDHWSYCYNHAATGQLV